MASVVWLAGAGSVMGTVKLTSEPVAVPLAMVPEPSCPCSEPVRRSPCCWSVSVPLNSCRSLPEPPSVTLSVQVPEAVAGPPAAVAAGRSSTCRPSMKRCATRRFLSNRSPRVTVRFAILPTSIEPSWFETPRISAGLNVKALTASSRESPASTARAALAR